MTQDYEMTRRASNAIQRAENLRARVMAREISTEMLLLALAQEYEGLAAQVLMNLGGGITCEDVQREIRNLTGLNFEEGQ